MATEPSFLSDGYTPRSTDTRYMRWLKILGRRQSYADAQARWNPRRNDTLREIQVKLLHAIRGDA